jgi:hypothetical protein
LLASDRLQLQGDRDVLAVDQRALAGQFELSKQVEKQLTSEAAALHLDREALSEQFALSKEVEKHLVGEALVLQTDREALSKKLAVQMEKQLLDEANARKSESHHDAVPAHPHAAGDCADGCADGCADRGTDVVLLNVGGVRLEASRIALERVDGSLLQKMFGRCGGDAVTVRTDPCDGNNPRPLIPPV